MKDGLHIGNCGTERWYLHGQRHRVDGPAVEYTDGSKSWYINGQRHRVDGPAVDHVGKIKEWWLNGNLVYSKECNYLELFTNIPESFKMSIIKYELSK
jgi:hypothetical protein